MKTNKMREKNDEEEEEKKGTQKNSNEWDGISHNAMSFVLKPFFFSVCLWFCLI